MLVQAGGGILPLGGRGDALEVTGFWPGGFGRYPDSCYLRGDFRKIGDG